MSQALTTTAKAAIDRYLDLLTSGLPGAVEGVYLTGSVALGDWRENRSDLDILTVANRPLTDTDVDALAQLHARANERPYLDAIYVWRNDLGVVPPADDPGLPHAVNGAFERSGYLPDPVLWATLDRLGITLLGPPAAELGTGPDPAWLRAWNLGNLRSYWLPWAADVRKWLSRQEPTVLLEPEVATHALLGPGRLHYTIATGDILAKTAAADYTAKLFPGHDELLARAKAWRLGDEGVQFDKSDTQAACDLIEAIAQAATEL
jgi:hypothetical protein